MRAPGWCSMTKRPEASATATSPLYRLKCKKRDKQAMRSSGSQTGPNIQKRNALVWKLDIPDTVCPSDTRTVTFRVSFLSDRPQTHAKLLPEYLVEYLSEYSILRETCSQTHARSEVTSAPTMAPQICRRMYRTVCTFSTQTPWMSGGRIQGYGSTGRASRVPLSGLCYGCLGLNYGTQTGTTLEGPGTVSIRWWLTSFWFLSASRGRGTSVLRMAEQNIDWGCKSPK